ncbi:MAG: glycosyltransferase [Pseudomonadales bacterium]|nr:glycosyltransferase [Pseudomonadales bacterium]MCP5344135.1 glycosyltransferase [Pseudomonadales bacterium]
MTASSLPAQAPSSLSVSVVVYRPDLAVLEQTLETLLASAVEAQRRKALSSVSVCVVHNALAPNPALTGLMVRMGDSAREAGINLELQEGHGNVGYGRGHNRVIRHIHSDYHLILNPDVVLGAATLMEGLGFMAAHPDIIALSPAVDYPDGSKQYVCKRFPSVLDFVLRGFAPRRIKAWFAQRLARYEMRDLPEDQASTDIPIISGCFMLFRTPALQAVQGFDERYFLYFEDFDLSLRVHSQGALAYLPTMHIQHLGGHSARKGLRHIAMFVRSGIRFYNTHGWRFF